jgi:co-chaperonin GroES (HSP10)
MHLWSILPGRRLLASLVAGLALLASVVPVMGAPASDLGSLDVIPEGTPLVLQVRGIKGVVNRVMAFLDKALPDQAPLVKGFVDSALEDGFGGRKLAGLTADGPIFVIFPELPKPEAERPKFAVALSVSNFNAFRDAIFVASEKKSFEKKGKLTSAELETGDKVYFAEYKGFFVVSQAEDAVNKIIAGGESISSKLGKSQGARLLGNDVAFYLNLDRLSKDYADAIKAAKKEAKEAIKNLIEQAPKEQKAQLNAGAGLIDPAFQLIEDSKGFVGGIDFRADGIVLSLDDELRAASKSFDILSELKPMPAKAIDKLPVGQMMYMGSASAGSLLKIAGPAFKALLKDTPEAAKAIDLLAGLEFGDSASAADMPLAGLEIRNTTEGAKHVAATLASLESSLNIGGGLSSPVKGKPKVTKNDQTAAGISFTRVEIEFDLDKLLSSQEGLPEEMKKGMTDWFKKIMGSKVNMWIGSDSKRMIQITASDWEKAETILKEHLEGKTLISQSAYKSARANLPDDATAMLIIDPVKYGNLIVGLLKDIAGGAIPIPPGLGKGKANPSYFGMSVSLHSGRLGADYVFTADSVRELYNAYAKPFLP